MPINSFLYPGAKFTPAYKVANSCRFNQADTAYMHKTPSSSGSQRTFTFSTWWKQGDLGSSSVIFSSGESDGDPNFAIYYNSSQQLNVLYYEGSSLLQLITNAQYRDPSAWYHICVAIDTTQSTNTDRAKIYINGSQVTSLGTATYCNQNVDISINTSSYRMAIGAGVSNGDVADGYAAETVFIDSSALAPTSFGEFDDDTPTIWKPIDVSGLTFGTNGFYCDYEDSANLGNDANGGTDLTEVNLAAADQATDTPTNNFCTLNPLSKDEMTFAEGNCKVTQASDDGGGSRTDDNARGTIGVSSGKWYWEVKCTGGSTPVVVGICFDELKMGSDLSGSTGVYAIQNASATNAYKRENGTTAETSGFTNPAVNDIINVALDMDNGKLYIGINGTYENQAGSTGNPASGSNETFSSISTNYFWLPWIESRGDNQVAECNFGGCPVFSISSGNADANGYGNFEYAVPSGYLALCTKNLGSDGG